VTHLPLNMVTYTDNTHSAFDFCIDLVKVDRRSNIFQLGQYPHCYRHITMSHITRSSICLLTKYQVIAFNAKQNWADHV